MNDKIKRCLCIVIIFLLLFLMSYPITVATIDPCIYKDATSSIVMGTGSSRHYAFPGCCYMENGDFLVIAANSSSHNDVSSIVGKISPDNGSTWGHIFDVQESIYLGGHGNGRTTAPCVGTMPNGKVIVVFCKSSLIDGIKNNSAVYKESTDNGTTWSGGVHGKYENFTTSLGGSIWLATASQFVTVGNTVYMCAWRWNEPPDASERDNATLLKTIDNGTTWSVVNWTIWNHARNLVGGEMGMLAISDTHFLATFRNDTNQQHPPAGTWTGLQAESFDAGVTWTNWRALDDVTPVDGQLISPQLFWLNQAHGIAIMTCGAQRSKDSSSDRDNCVFVTKDNGTTWQNKTTYSVGNGGGDAGYLYFAQRHDWTNKGILIYYDGSNGDGADVFLNHVYDNRSYPEPPPVVNEIHFVSIDSNTNNSPILSVNPTFIWNKVANTDYYELQVSSNKVFSDILVDVNGINSTNYPMQYSQNATAVTFVLAPPDTLPLESRYYFRVRAHREL